MRNFSILSVLLLLGVAVLGKPAHAVYVGVAVGGIGSTSAVATGNVATDGTINFYIPLKASTSGVFGVTGVSSDTCNADPNGCGGSLDMYLRYSGLSAGTNQFSFNFNDLDILGANDTTSFLETVDIQLFDGSSTALSSLVAFTALTPPSATGDRNNQLLTVTGSILATGDVWAKLHFTSNLTATSGRWRNTPEKIYAWAGPVSVVPLPAALPLYGTGLAFLGLIRWRRTKKQTA